VNTINGFQVLGCEPYNLLTKQADGYAIYTYLYKLVERMVDPKVINERGGESAGNEVYNSKIEHVFLLFELLLSGKHFSSAKKLTYRSFFCTCHF